MILHALESGVDQSSKIYLALTSSIISVIFRFCIHCADSILQILSENANLVFSLVRRCLPTMARCWIVDSAISW